MTIRCAERGAGRGNRGAPPHWPEGEGGIKGGGVLSCRELGNP